MVGMIVSTLSNFARETPGYLYARAFLDRGQIVRTRRVVGRTTDILIDGFPRCANTFAYFSFILSNHKNIKVANHIHSSAQFIRAAQLGIPSLLLLREPRATVISAALYYPHLHLEHILHRYLLFHSKLDRVSDQIVISDFGTTINRFDRVIKRVNERFGTHFNEPEYGESFRRDVELRVNQHFQRLNEQSRKNMRAGKNALPDNMNHEERARLREALNSTKLAGMMAESEQIYAALLGRSTVI